MTFHKSTKVILPLIALAISFSAVGCSPSSPDVETISVPTSNPTSSPKMTDLPNANPNATDYRLYGFVEETDPRGVKFISDLNSQYPDLAGFKDSHQKIKPGRLLCAEISMQNRLFSHAMTHEEIKHFISVRTEPYLDTRIATDEEADGIAHLAIQDICPEYSSLLG